MRKLAREAVIFMLLGWILLTVGMFVGLYATTPSKVKNTVQTPEVFPTPEECRKLGLNSQMSHAQITSALQKATKEDDPDGPFSDFKSAISDKLARQADVCLATQNHPPAQKFDPQDPLASLGGVPVATPPTQSAQEAPLQPPPEFIHNVDYSISDFMMESLFVGSFGFLAGLGLWIFYRVVRFAIKG